MDRRSLLLLAATSLILVLWYPLMNRVYPPKIVPITNQVAAAGSTNLTVDTAAASATAGPAAPGAPATAALAPGIADPGFRAPAGPATEIFLENEWVRYVITSHGGGIREVELKKHADSINCRDRKAGITPARAALNRLAQTPMMALLGLETPGSEPVYQLAKSNEVVVATRELSNGLRVVKEFRLGSNYVSHITTRLQNWSANAKSVPAQEWVFGTAAPLHPSENVMYQGLFTYDGNGNEHITEAWFANRFLGCFPGTPKAEFVSERTNTVWSAVHNQFFATLIQPRDRNARVFARHLSLTPRDAAPKTMVTGYQTALLYGAEELPAQQERVREFDLYVGPKEYSTVSSLGNNADVVMGFDSYFGGRFSGFFARALLLAMNGLHAVGVSYALAIILITVIVRLLFWPLMAASARTSKRMAALQPKIKELQEKYKDNPQKLNQKMLELWREHKVNPASGCVPVLVQFPILLGFYSMLQTAIELRGESFLWACDLSQSDTIGMLPGLNFPINPLPLLMGVTMFWQAKLTPAAPTMDPAQQKIMKYMPLMFMVFLYNFSAGLTLYWTVSNILSITQMKLTRAREEKPPATPGTPGSPAAPGRRPRPDSGSGRSK